MVAIVEQESRSRGVSKRFSSHFPDDRLAFEFLAAQGYTVLNVDYKGSRGYGRESRTSVYRQVGGPDLDSVLAGVEFLVTRHHVDRKRIGIYGHSYGGFLTVMALLKHPGVFAAGAALAPVAAHAHNPALHFATQMLNVPWRDDEADRGSSPIYFADRLQDRLLILQGVVDSSVPFQDSLRLVQRFIEFKKTGWDLAVYPVESHVPREETSRLDIERRRFALWESVLKAAPAKR